MKFLFAAAVALAGATPSLAATLVASGFNQPSS